jgi:hypothetical protein
MAFVNGYDYDVFISYAHADNEADALGEAWVSVFVQNLQTALEQRSGKVGQIKFYYDNTNLQGNHPLEEILRNVTRSATFVAVCSPTYATRDWTRDELRTFVTAGDPTRLFAIERIPLYGDDRYPDPLNDYHRIPFWQKDQVEADIALPITPQLNAALYYARVHKLAEQIRGQLVQMRDRAPAPAAAPRVMAAFAQVSPAPGASASQPRPAQVQPVASVPAAPASGIKPVVVAQVTEDLEYEREQLVSYLGQYNIPGLPAEPYPQGGSEFRQAVAADLAQSALFVQLLGPISPRKTRDLPEGYLVAQNDLAVQAGVQIIKWRSPTLDLERVMDKDHKAQLLGETVVMTGFESFKAEVVRLATPPPPPVHHDDSVVFVNADIPDQNLAESVFKTLRDKKMPVILAQPHGTAKEVREDLERNWRECGAVILVYGQANPFWVRNQIMLYTRLKPTRRAPPKPFKLLYAPPEEKSPVGVALPEVDEVDCREGLTPERVDQLLAGIA